VTKYPQRPPQPDNRYRVHRSVKCYLADLACGSKSCTWFFSDSIERVVYIFDGRMEKVQYRNSYYPLHPAERMNDLVQTLIGEGASIYIGGKSVSAQAPDNSFDAYPFIAVYSKHDMATYESFKKTSSS
jgi:hypothetical protein